MDTRGSLLGVEWPGCEADHSPQSNVEVKNPPIHLHGVVLS